MGRKRVLVLGPALVSRMRFVDNPPYEKIEGREQLRLTGGKMRSPTSSSSSSSSRFFNWGWRRKKSKKLQRLKLGDKKRRRLRFKVSSKLRIIRLVSSPLLLLKKLRDSYVRLLLALERDCGEYGGALAMSNYPMYPMYLFV